MLLNLLVGGRTLCHQRSFILVHFFEAYQVFKVLPLAICLKFFRYLTSRFVVLRKRFEKEASTLRHSTLRVLASEGGITSHKNIKVHRI